MRQAAIVALSAAVVHTNYDTSQIPDEPRADRGDRTASPRRQPGSNYISEKFSQSWCERQLRGRWGRSPQGLFGSHQGCSCLSCRVGIATRQVRSRSPRSLSASYARMRL